MPTYNANGWVWSGLGSPTTLLAVTVTDDDPNMSPYFTNDFNEVLTINGTSYTNPRGGTYELTFTDSGGTTHTEDLLLFYTGSNFIFVPMPGSAFDTGSVVNSLGGWQSWTSGFVWDDVVCFANGTEITTPSGSRPVETLSIGDLVLTKDNGIQAIRWIGKKRITGARLNAMPHLRPILIKKDAFGKGYPEKDLRLSPQHRVLCKSRFCALHFGVDEVLAPAKGLINDVNIYADHSVKSVDYYHILFDKHEIVFSNGLTTESFQPGDMSFSALENAALAELLEIFPEFKWNTNSYGPTARHSLSVKEIEQVLAYAH
jgi:hypothetical protein